MNTSITSNNLWDSSLITLNSENSYSINLKDDYHESISLSDQLIKETLNRNKDLVNALDSILIQRAEELLENPDLLFNNTREESTDDLISFINREFYARDQKIYELEQSIVSLRGEIDYLRYQVETLFNAVNLP